MNEEIITIKDPTIFNTNLLCRVGDIYTPKDEMPFLYIEFMRLTGEPTEKIGYIDGKPGYSITFPIRSMSDALTMKNAILRIIEKLNIKMEKNNESNI